MSTIRFQFKHGHVLPHHGTAIFRGDDALALPSAPLLVVAGRQFLFVFLSFRDREVNQQATYLPSRAEQASVRGIPPPQIEFGPGVECTSEAPSACSVVCPATEH
jgi:hypothetical protein